MTRHTRILIIGAALILGGNAVALVGVAYNRSGQPDAVVELSDRELTRPYSYSFSTRKENSGLALRLKWRNADDTQVSMAGILTRGGGRAPWLDKDKLAELGFDVDIDPQELNPLRIYKKSLPRKAYVVLEFNGPAYQAAVRLSQANLDEAQAKLTTDPGNKAFETKVKFAQRQLDNERNKSTRLFAVDVGPDPETLRGRYPDRGHYIILPSQVRLAVYNKALTGYITGLNVDTINVPLAYRTTLTGGEGGRLAHFTLRLAFGKRGEPWILGAKAE